VAVRLLHVRWLEEVRLRRPQPARCRRLPLLHQYQDGDEPLARARPARGRELRHPHDALGASMTIMTTVTADEREAILDAVREYAETELAPFAAERDEKHLFPRESLRRGGELGLGGIYVGEEFGGTA